MQNSSGKPYSLTTYTAPDGKAIAGIVVDGRIYPAAATVSAAVGEPRYAFDMVLGILEQWDTAQRELAVAVDKIVSGQVTTGVAVEQAQLLAPVLYPSAVYGSGANYSDHMEEMVSVLNVPIENPKEQGQIPWHFIKTPRNTVVGHRAIVDIPAYSSMVDWEIELAAVVGKTAHCVSVKDALTYIAGYTIANDLSARDHVKRADVKIGSPFAYDWVSQKCFNGSCPLGPALVPAQFVPDPLNLSMKLWVNGSLKQDSGTHRMIFSIAEQVAHLSSRTTLFPGDVILTGTPAGVGMARREFLKKGDVVRLEIEGLGVLENTIR